MRNEGFVLSAPTKLDRAPTLVDLCVQSAIDNIQRICDVGETDLTLLARILPHCTVEQLYRIESSSESRDLSSITDELWHKFYIRKFGIENTNLVLERMTKKKCVFKWRLLYQAKLREQEEVQNKCVDRLKELYKEADIQKQSRQTQLCFKVPPSRKRGTIEFGGGSSNQFNHIKGRLMRKSRIEFAASNQAKRMKPEATSSKFQVCRPPVTPLLTKPLKPSERETAFRSSTGLNMKSEQKVHVDTFRVAQEMPRRLKKI